MSEESTKFKVEADLSGVSNAFTQITREMPSFVNSLQTGFMAISNNIGPLADAIINLRKQNEELVKQGQPTKNIFGQIASSLLSWNTAISVGITLLTVYGPKIVEWVSSLVKGKESVSNLSREIGILNDKTKSKDIENSLTKYEELISKLDRAAKGYYNKKDAIDQYNKSFGQSLGITNDVNVAEEKLLKNKKDYLDFLIKEAAAKEVLNDLVKNEIESKKAENIYNEKVNKIEEKYTSGGYHIKYNYTKGGNIASTISPEEQKKIDLQYAKDDYFKNKNILDEQRKTLVKTYNTYQDNLRVSLFDQNDNKPSKDNKSLKEKELTVKDEGESIIKKVIDSTITSIENVKRKLINGGIYNNKDIEKDTEFVLSALNKYKFNIDAFTNDLIKNALLTEEEKIKRLKEYRNQQETFTYDRIYFDYMKKYTGEIPKSRNPIYNKDIPLEQVGKPSNYDDLIAAQEIRVSQYRKFLEIEGLKQEDITTKVIEFRKKSVDDQYKYLLDKEKEFNDEQSKIRLDAMMNQLEVDRKYEEGVGKDKKKQYKEYWTEMNSIVGEASKIGQDFNGVLSNTIAMNDEISSRATTTEAQKRALWEQNKELMIEQAYVSEGMALAQALVNATAPTPDNEATGGLSGILKYAVVAATIWKGISDIERIQNMKYSINPVVPKAPLRYADGGILQGPSHAQGGISTPYGELEGGEIVLNKRVALSLSGLKIASALNQQFGGADFGGTNGSPIKVELTNPHMIQATLTNKVLKKSI